MGRGTGAAGIAVELLVSLGSVGRKLGSETVAERRQLAAGAHAAVASEAVLMTGLVGGWAAQRCDQ